MKISINCGRVGLPSLNISWMAFKLFFPEPDPRLPVTEARGTGSGGQPPILLVLTNVKKKVLDLPHRLLSIDTEAKWGHGTEYWYLKVLIFGGGRDRHFL